MRGHALALFGLAVSASALISLPLKQHVPTAAEVARLDASTNTSAVSRERSRLRVKRDRVGSTRPVTATNLISSYGVEISVGEKSQHKCACGWRAVDWAHRTDTLVVDTGSSTLWVGAQTNKPYVKTSSSRLQKPQPFSDKYASGSMTGAYYKDTVRIGSARLPNQGLGAARQSSGFSASFDGVLGLGPITLTCGRAIGDAR